MLTAFINGFVDVVSAAESVQQIGAAFLTSIGPFAYDSLAVFDPSKTETFASSLVFTSGDTRREFIALNRQVPFADNPIVKHALSSDRPYDLNDVRLEHDIPLERWESALPPHLLQRRAVLLPVHRNGELKLLAGAAGMAEMAAATNAAAAKPIARRIMCPNP